MLGKEEKYVLTLEKLTSLIEDTKDFDLKHAHKKILKKFSTEYLNFISTHIITENIEKLSTKQKALIHSVKDAIYQYKKATFQHLIWRPHWFDDEFFDLGVINLGKKKPMYNYALGVAFICLEDDRDYTKMIATKWKIKKNLKFSPARDICLHWYRGYRVYGND